MKAGYSKASSIFSHNSKQMTPEKILSVVSADDSTQMPHVLKYDAYFVLSTLCW